MPMSGGRAVLNGRRGGGGGVWDPKVTKNVPKMARSVLDTLPPLPHSIFMATPTPRPVLNFFFPKEKGHPPPPLQTKVTIVGKNEICNW